MIIEMLLNVFAVALRAPFALLPSLPKFPDSLFDLVNSFMIMMTDAIAFVQYVYGFEFFNSIVVFGLGMFAFTTAYYFVMWVIRKIPGGMD